MKKADLLFAIITTLLFIPFFISEEIYLFYSQFNASHGFITSFIKFAVLATAGELLGLRIRTGKYYISGFGIIPRAIVWGVLGLAIKAAFMIFGSGVPVVVSYLGLDNAISLMSEPLSMGKVLVAFSISLCLNMVFAPVMMTLHKVTDAHIIMTGGTLNGFVSSVEVLSIVKSINWDMHWGFVLKKTIPLFWIPAHTITFLLPESIQVLFAALLGVVLGVILAFAARAKCD